MWGDTLYVRLEIASENTATILRVVTDIFLLQLHDINILGLFDCFWCTDTALFCFVVRFFFPGSCSYSAFSASLQISKNSPFMTRLSDADVSHPWMLKSLEFSEEVPWFES